MNPDLGQFFDESHVVIDGKPVVCGLNPRGLAYACLLSIFMWLLIIGAVVGYWWGLL